MTRKLPLPERVAETIRRLKMIGPGDRVLVAVSGGADSVCLVTILTNLGFEVGVAHFNHGWRGEASDGDETFVKTLASQLGLGFFVGGEQSNLRAGNLEEQARLARGAFLDQIAEREDFTKVALAHSRNDRNETVLLNLLRGSGSEGLVSMRPVARNTIRPLIETTRKDIETYIQAIGQSWRSDATNSDHRFARNRIRHDVLPRLASEFNPRLQDTLARTVEILQDEDAWMSQLVEAWLDTHTRSEGLSFEVQIDGLSDQPVGFTRRLLREALRRAGSPLIDIGFDHIESIRSILSGPKSGKVVELPGSIQVERSFDKLILRDVSDEPLDYQYDLQVPGVVRIPEIGTSFEARFTDLGASKPRQGRVFVDGESLGPYVKIRNWRNGDFYDPVGLPSAKLVKLFQKGRIPRWRRRQWPVLVAGSTIVWVASFPVSREFIPSGRSRRIVEFEASPIAEGRDVWVGMESKG